MTIPYDERWSSDQLLRMPFDHYQRYRLAAELVLALKHAAGAPSARWQLLDVGGFFRPVGGEPRLPLCDFSPDDDSLVVDMAPFEHPRYRQATGTALPFEDGAFDVVVSCDTLEHIPPAGRAAFLGELRRVSRRAVVLAAPHATPGVRMAEQSLAEYLRGLGLVNDMLDEHFLYGLPEPALVEQQLSALGADYLAFPSGYLPRWSLMMLLKHQLFMLPGASDQHLLLDRLYNERFYERDQRGPAYRRAYVIACPGQQLEPLRPFVERAARPEPDDASADLLGLVAAPLLQAVTLLARRSHEPESEYGYAQVLRRMGELEGEKKILHEQLELLRWQNELLHARLNRPLLGGLPGRLLQALRRLRGQEPGARG